MPLPDRAWDAQLLEWASQQTKPFTWQEAVKGARLKPAKGGEINRCTVRRALIRIGFCAARRRIGPKDRPMTWWRKAPAASPSTLEARVHDILSLRQTLDQAATGLVDALESWELELVARQDAPPVNPEAIFEEGRQHGRREREAEIPPPPPPVDTAEIFEAGRAQGRQEREAEIPPPPPVVDREAVFSAGQQEGRQSREVEILALLDQQLALLREGTQGYLQLWALKNAITGSNK